MIVDTGQPTAPLLTQLSLYEQQTLLHLPTERQRRQSLLARHAARRAVEALLVDPCSSRIEVLQAPNGAPLASIDGQSGIISLSLSHSDRLAVAIAWRDDERRGYSLGVDLERIRPTEIATSRYAFSRGERKLIREAPRGAMLNSLAAWIAKEAAWKAMRPDPEYGPDTVELVSLNLPGGRAAVRPRGKLSKLYGDTILTTHLSVMNGADESYLLALAELCHPATRESQSFVEQIEKQGEKSL